MDDHSVAGRPASSLSHQPRTPEPQRFHTRHLGCYPDPCLSSSTCAAVETPAHVAARLYEDEEGFHLSPHAQRPSLPHVREAGEEEQEGEATWDEDRRHRAAPCTPRTVCQRTQQQHRHAEPLEAPPHVLFAVTLSPGHTAAAPPAASSSCSLVPPAGEGVVVHRARSLSCPSANRSLAPGRYTVLLPAAPCTGADLCGTPYAGASAASRPTVLLHGPTNHDGVREAAHDAVRWPVCAPHGPGAVASASSVPRLTRLSMSSNGHSPAVQVSWSIGRPTTLRCHDAESEGPHGWSSTAEGDEDGDVDRAWMGGSTQVWRGSAETRASALPTQPSVHRRTQHQDGLVEEEEEEEEALFAMPTGQGASRSRVAPVTSPPVTWKPAPPSPTAFPASQPDFSACAQDAAVLLSGAPVTCSAEEGEGEEERARGGDAAPDEMASFADLEAAPRKSYVRSNCGTPPPCDLGGSGTTHAAAPAHTSAPTLSTATAAASQLDGRPQQGRGGAIMFAGVEWDGDGTRPVAVGRQAGEAALQVPTKWSRSAGLHTPQGREAPAPRADAASLASAVAAQLARLSIQASPTQKRLAFEEEEGLDAGSAEGGSEGESPTRQPDACDGVNGSCFHRRVVPKFGFAAQKGTGSGAVGPLGRNADGASSSGRAPTGLQLLRSRKRCLAEMQATDGEGASCHMARSVRSGCAASAPQIVLEGRLDADAVKRQKHEEERRQRLQHLDPAAASAAADDLIPAPTHTSGPNAGARTAAASFGQDPVAVAQDAVNEGPLVQHRLQSGDTAPWSQLSGISYVTPASQSTSCGLWGLPSYSSQGLQAAVAVAVSGSSQGSSSHVLAALPTNLAAQPALRKP